MPSPATTPRKLGRYDILERLATGGMAEIFLACERGMHGLERLVVIKKILPHLAEQEAFVQMFVEEARIVARLTHPNVVQIHDLAEQDGEAFIAMEYVAGSTLRLLTDMAEQLDSPVPVDVAVGIVTQACRGLHSAHELKDGNGRSIGLVHRDISPHNLMVTSEGHVKLLDFGIAKATEKSEHTATGSLKGKFCYMSPEQVNQQQLDRRSDVFSLGIVLWEMLAMKRLYKRDSELSSLNAIVTEDVPRVDSIRKDVPAPIALVVQRALARDRDARIATADDFRRQLTDAAEACGLSIHDDVVGRYVHRILGPQHDARRKQVDRAIDNTMAARTPAAKHQDVHLPVETRIRPTADAVTQLEIPRARNAPPEPSVDGKWRTPLIAVLVALVGACVALATLLYMTDPDRAEAPRLVGTPVRVGFPPVMDQTLQQRELEPLRRYLEGALKRPVQFSTTGSYEELAERVVKGEYQFGSFPPFLYLKTRAHGGKVEALVFKLFAGSSGTDGVVLVPESSPVSTLKDLGDKRFCFTDRDSLTGFNLPRAALKMAGVDVDAVVARAHFSGDHLSVLRDLIDGKCDAGATYSGAYLSADRVGIAVAKLRVLAITGRSPHDAICAGPAATPEERAELADALMAFEPKRHTGQDLLGEVQRISGFSRGSDEAYDMLRGALIRVGALPAAK